MLHCNRHILVMQLVDITIFLCVAWPNDWKSTRRRKSAIRQIPSVNSCMHAMKAPTATDMTKEDVNKAALPDRRTREQLLDGRRELS
jgi:hypothetical protein